MLLSISACKTVKLNDWIANRVTLNLRSTNTSIKDLYSAWRDKTTQVATFNHFYFLKLLLVFPSCPMYVQEELHSKSIKHQHLRHKVCLVSYQHNNNTSSYIQSLLFSQIIISAVCNACARRVTLKI